MRRRSSSHDSIERDENEAAKDALFGGALTLWQPRRGYRVNVDTLLLAAFAATNRPRARRVVDLGAGVGALGLAYAFLATVERVDFIERTPALCVLARRNLEAARASGTVHGVDLATDGLPHELHGRADVVLSNPPFFEAREGRPAMQFATRDARTGPLLPFLRAAAAALGRRAAVFFAYPARALPELFTQSKQAGLVPKRLRLVHAYATSPARLALVELRRAKPGGLSIDPPAVEWIARGERSEELSRLVAGKR